MDSKLMPEETVREATLDVSPVTYQAVGVKDDGRRFVIAGRLSLHAAEAVRQYVLTGDRHATVCVEQESR